MYTAIYCYDRTWIILDPQHYAIATTDSDPTDLLSHLNRDR
jgi:hypothetical protein